MAAAAAVAAARQDVGKNKCLSDSSKIELRKTFFLLYSIMKQRSVVEDMMMKRLAQVNKDLCVSCGECGKRCPKGAIGVYKGMYALVDAIRCIGCGICAKNCPAGVIKVVELHE